MVTEKSDQVDSYRKLREQLPNFVGKQPEVTDYVVKSPHRKANQTPLGHQKSKKKKTVKDAKRHKVNHTQQMKPKWNGSAADSRRRISQEVERTKNNTAHFGQTHS